jgi:hypothetical protein
MAALDPKLPFALFYSMTSSARARIDGGTARPSALAVLRLTTSLKTVGCWTGRSAGLISHFHLVSPSTSEECRLEYGRRRELCRYRMMAR